MKYFLGLLSLFFFGISNAQVTCFLNVVKGSCWNDYDVNVTVMDMSEHKNLAQIKVEKGKAWARGSFTCKPGQTLYFSAVFSPIFWKSDKGKVYHAKQYTSLPKAMGEDDVAWQLTACFPNDFSGIPLPPKAGADCSCQYNSVEPLKL